MFESEVVVQRVGAGATAARSAKREMTVVLATMLRMKCCLMAKELRAI